MHHLPTILATHLQNQTAAKTVEERLTRGHSNLLTLEHGGRGLWYLQAAVGGGGEGGRGEESPVG